MENYFCFGCNSESDGRANTTSKKIYMCKSYLESVWGAPLSGPTSTFDNCGFYTYWRTSPSAVVPSKVRFCDYISVFGVGVENRLCLL